MRKKRQTDDAPFVRALAQTARDYAASDEAFCAALARNYLIERGTPEIMPQTATVRRRRQPRQA